MGPRKCTRSSWTGAFVAERYFSPADVEALIPRLTRIMERVMAAYTGAGAGRDRLQGGHQRLPAPRAGRGARSPPGRATAHRPLRGRRARPPRLAGREGSWGAADRGAPARARRDREARRSPEGSRARAGRLPAPPRRRRGEPLLEVRGARDPTLARTGRRLHREKASLMRYRAVLFDLFDTLVRFNRRRR